MKHIHNCDLPFRDVNGNNFIEFRSVVTKVSHFINVD